MGSLRREGRGQSLKDPWYREGEGEQGKELVEEEEEEEKDNENENEKHVSIGY